MIEMEERKKEKIGKQLVKDTKIEQILEYFDISDILFQINDLDIVDRIDEHVLSMVDDEELVEGISNVDNVLSAIDTSDIIDYIEEKDYFVVSEDPDSINLMYKISDVCSDIQPYGYIGKEDMKKLINDYIDNNYTNGKIVNKRV
jgi:hypothetical protein